MNNFAELSMMLHQKAELDSQIKQYLETTFKDWLLSNIATLKLEFVGNGWSREHMSITFCHDFNLPLLDERIMFETGQVCHIESRDDQRLTLTFSTGWLGQPFVKNLLPTFLSNPQINETYNEVAF